MFKAISEAFSAELFLEIVAPSARMVKSVLRSALRLLDAFVSLGAHLSRCLDTFLEPREEF